MSTAPAGGGGAVGCLGRFRVLLEEEEEEEEGSIVDSVLLGVVGGAGVRVVGWW